MTTPAAPERAIADERARSAEITKLCTLHGRSADLGVDSRRMVVAGSSAGAHLAAMVLARLHAAKKRETST